MPIDPTIPLRAGGAAVGQPIDPLAMVQQVLAGQKLASDLRVLKQQEHERDLLQKILTRTGGDWKAAIPELRQTMPLAALKIEESFASQQKASADALRAQLELDDKRLDMGLQLIRGITDQSSQDLISPMLEKLHPGLGQLLGPTYEPTRLEQLQQIGMTAKELSDKRQEGLKLFTEGKANEAIGTWLSTATSAEEWNGMLETLVKDLRVPPALLAPYGQYSPANVERAAQLALTPQQRETLAGQRTTREQTLAHQQVMEAQGQERVDIARLNAQRRAGGAMTAQQQQDLDDTVQAIIDNPGLFDQLTPSLKAKVTPELYRRGYEGFGKPLPPTAVAQIAQTESAIASLNDLRTTLQENEQYIGPIAGLQAVNPWSTARQAQATIDLVRQRVGKALEGGVLRKEDEEKYKKILATLRDTPTTAIFKVDNLIKTLQSDLEIFRNQQKLSGRRVPAAPTPTSPSTTTGGGPGLTYQDYLASRPGSK